MNKVIKLDELTKRLLEPHEDFLGSGKLGNVYRISENLAGKFPHSCFSIHKVYEKLNREYANCQLAYDNEISVPKPEGILKIRHPETNKIVPAFVMEYIRGPTLEELYDVDKNSSLFKNLMKRYDEELDKAEKLGFVGIDDYLKNAIYCLKNNRLYVIDFEDWKFNSVA